MSLVKWEEDSRFKNQTSELQLNPYCLVLTVFCAPFHQSVLTTQRSISNELQILTRALHVYFLRFSRRKNVPFLRPVHRSMIKPTRERSGFDVTKDLRPTFRWSWSVFNFDEFAARMVDLSRHVRVRIRCRAVYEPVSLSRDQSLSIINTTSFSCLCVFAFTVSINIHIQIISQCIPRHTTVYCGPN